MKDLDNNLKSTIPLTGQAETDFETWFVQKEQKTIDTGKTIILIFFYSLTETMKNAEIIEWFDSVNIIINSKFFKYDVDYAKWSYSIRDLIASPYKFYSRQEAYLEAISKANEIYNTKLKDEN